MSTERRPSLPLNPQSLVGLLIVTAGLLLLADNLGLMEARRVLAYWPAGVLAVGILMFRRAVDSAARTWSLFICFVGGWWTLSLVMGWPVRLSVLFPAALVMIGVVIMQRALSRPSETPGTSDQAVSDLAFWAGIERKVNSALFRRADLTAVMGGDPDRLPAGGHQRRGGNRPVRADGWRRDQGAARLGGVEPVNRDHGRCSGQEHRSGRQPAPSRAARVRHDGGNRGEELVAGSGQCRTIRAGASGLVGPRNR